MDNNETREISREIIGIKFSANKKIGTAVKEFYAIMRKHGIKKGIPIRNDKGEIIGSRDANFDWTLYETLFTDQIKRMVETNMMFGIEKGYEFPEDLRYSEEDHG